MLQTVFERRFKITAALGDGSLGPSFSGVDLKTKTPVVAKFVRRELLSEPRVRNGFLAAVAMQRDLAGRPHSPEILAAQVEDERSAGSPVYLIRRFIKGYSARRALSSGGAIPLDVILEVLTAVIDYLDELETRGFRHGGLTPENVILTDDGTVCVLDPGLSANLVCPGTPVADARRPYIAPGYLDPPYFEDLRGDIFSLGRIVSDLLQAGRGKGAVEVERLAERLSRDVLERAVKLDPSARYARVAELREAVARVSAGGAKPSAPANVDAAAPASPEIEEIRRLASRCHDMDYYELFGIPTDASPDDVRQQYYKLLARFHPDRAAVPPLHQVRQELVVLSNKISAVHATLRDPIARQSYNERRTYRRGARAGAATEDEASATDAPEDEPDIEYDGAAPSSEEAPTPKASGLARLARRLRPRSAS